MMPPAGPKIDMEDHDVAVCDSCGRVLPEEFFNCKEDDPGDCDTQPTVKGQFCDEFCCADKAMEGEKQYWAWYFGQQNGPDRNVLEAMKPVGR